MSITLGEIIWEIGGVPRIKAMAATRDTLYVAGAPDVVDPEDPWAGLDGRRGGVLRSISKSDGAHGAGFTLPAPPVFHGMAAAYGSLFVCCSDGTLVHLGE